jgi:hypothetical protein
MLWGHVFEEAREEIKTKVEVPKGRNQQQMASCATM